MVGVLVGDGDSGVGPELLMLLQPFTKPGQQMEFARSLLDQIADPILCLETPAFNFNPVGLSGLTQALDASKDPLHLSHVFHKYARSGKPILEQARANCAVCSGMLSWLTDVNNMTSSLSSLIGAPTTKALVDMLRKALTLWSKNCPNTSGGHVVVRQIFDPTGFRKPLGSEIIRNTSGGQVVV